MKGTNNQRPKGNLANVVCFWCHQMDHIAPNCPNPMAEVSYVLMCGNFKQNGHIAYECNAPKKIGLRDNDGYVKPDSTPKLVLISEESNRGVNRNINRVEIEDVSGREDLHSEMVHQI